MVSRANGKEFVRAALSEIYFAEAKMDQSIFLRYNRIVSNFDSFLLQNLFFSETIPLLARGRLQRRNCLHMVLNLYKTFEPFLCFLCYQMSTAVKMLFPAI